MSPLCHGLLWLSLADQSGLAAVINNTDSETLPHFMSFGYKLQTKHEISNPADITTTSSGYLKLITGVLYIHPPLITCIKHTENKHTRTTVKSR